MSDKSPHCSEAYPASLPLTPMPIIFEVLLFKVFVLLLLLLFMLQLLRYANVVEVVTEVSFGEIDISFGESFIGVVLSVRVVVLLQFLSKLSALS